MSLNANELESSGRLGFCENGSANAAKCLGVVSRRPPSGDSSGALPVFALALLLLLQAPRPAVCAPPAWSWERLPTFMHCSNFSGPLSDAAVATMAASGFTVIEKYQALLSPPAFSGEEARAVAAARAIRRANPNATVLYYAAVDLARTWYEWARALDAAPACEAHNADGSLVAHASTDHGLDAVFHVPDYATECGRAAFLNSTAAVVEEALFDGVFVDGYRDPSAWAAHIIPNASAAAQAAWLAGAATLGPRLAQLLGGSVRLVNGGANPQRDWPGFNGVSIEFFYPSDSDIEFLMSAAVQPGVDIIEVHNYAFSDANYNETIAAYLIGASRGAFLGIGAAWDTCEDWIEYRQRPEFSRPLGGAPDGPATHTGGVWRRTFGDGATSVELSTAKLTSCIRWADGSTTGSACGAGPRSFDAADDGGAAGSGATRHALAAFPPDNLAVRAPAVPLIVTDPFLSQWSPADGLADEYTRHWTMIFGGGYKAMSALIRIDGSAFRLLGPECPAGATPAFPQLGFARVYASSTVVHFAGAGIALNLTFTQPVFGDGAARGEGLPLSYVIFDAASADGQAHDVQLYLDATAQLVENTDSQPVEWARAEAELATEGAVAVRIGTASQQPFDGYGDDFRIDWGRLYLAGVGANASAAAASSNLMRFFFVANGTLPPDETAMPLPACAASQSYICRCNSPGGTGEANDWPAIALTLSLTVPAAPGGAPASAFAVLAYDDLPAGAARFFGVAQSAFWRSLGRSVGELVDHALQRFDAVMAASVAGDLDVVQQLRGAGLGEEYERLGSLAFREALGANKLTWYAGEFGPSSPPELHVWVKGCGSSGDTGTLDDNLPAVPLFLWSRAHLVPAFLAPLFMWASNQTFANTSAPFPRNMTFDEYYAPHYLGQHPDAELQCWQSPPDNHCEQMPIEMSASAIQIVAAHAAQTGDYSFAERFWALLERWAGYLMENGLYPGSQRSSDDYEGFIVNSTHLAAKAAIALGAFSQLANVCPAVQTCHPTATLWALKPNPSQTSTPSPRPGHGPRRRRRRCLADRDALPRRVAHPRPRPSRRSLHVDVQCARHLEYQVQLPFRRGARSWPLCRGGGGRLRLPRLLARDGEALRLGASAARERCHKLDKSGLGGLHPRRVPQRGAEARGAAPRLCECDGAALPNDRLVRCDDRKLRRLCSARAGRRALRARLVAGAAREKGAVDAFCLK